MKPLPFREVKRRLEAAGFVEVGQTGSHLKFAKTSEEEPELPPCQSTWMLRRARFEAYCGKQGFQRPILTSSKKRSSES